MVPADAGLARVFPQVGEHPRPDGADAGVVMFDLRPIGGAASLYTDLQAEVLDMATKNSIFVAHMISNSLKHTPPLGLLRGFATIRSGEYKNHIDLKMNGVVPVVDLGRIYALIGQLPAVNTRARLEAAAEAGVISASGARDLIEAYDLIAETRLEHQARRVKGGESRTTSSRRPNCRISNEATCATPLWSSAPCNPPWARPAAPEIETGE
jgi:CBS domain-containing protein